MCHLPQPFWANIVHSPVFGNDCYQLVRVNRFVFPFAVSPQREESKIKQTDHFKNLKMVCGGGEI